MRHPGEGRGPVLKKIIRKLFGIWIPAFAGMTTLLVSLPSCTKERRNVLSDSLSSGPTGPATLSTIQIDIFRLGCSLSGCHDSSPSPAAGINLTTVDLAHASLVNRPSTQGTGLVMVTPGFPEDSYLINKLRGTHLAVGGIGDRMPQYAAVLDEGEIVRIEEWITAGALKN